MSKKLITTILCIVFLAALGASFVLKREPVSITVMSMTESGYSPSSVTIRKGDAVRFVNASQSAYLWPASNLHPTHELYPEFDPREPLGPGEEWTFVFEEAGEWSYHDHLKPRIRGVISVIE
jgi:plastocyanin